MTQYTTHSDPVWRARANFIVNAPLREAGRFEQLWTRRASTNRFEVCCIPFFLYNVALGDTVKVDVRPDGSRGPIEVISRSGRFVFRAFFGQGQQADRPRVTKALVALDAQVEWSGSNLLSCDAADEAHAQIIADFLAAEESAERLVYESGKS